MGGPAVSTVPSIAGIALWLWIAAALLAYLWQFRDLVPDILRILGLT